MKLTKFLTLEGPMDPPTGYQALINQVKKKGGEKIGSGDYGVAFKVGSKVFKVTTDEVEIEHAKLLKGKKTENFVHIYEVKEVKPNLGLIVMDLLRTRTEPVDREFREEIEREAKNLGIDPDELDFTGNNIMVDSTGKLRMIDV